MDRVHPKRWIFLSEKKRKGKLWIFLNEKKGNPKRWIISNVDNFKMHKKLSGVMGSRANKNFYKYETKITVKTESPPEMIKVRVRARLLKDDIGERRL